MNTATEVSATTKRNVLKFIATVSTCGNCADEKAAHEMAAETQTVLSGALHELDGPLALEDFEPVLAKRAPEGQAERRASLVRYLAAICIRIVGTLAWQSYGEATKQTAATLTSEASELGWPPESNLARWVQQLEWTKPPDAAVWLLAPETSQPLPVAQVVTETLDDAARRQLIAVSLAALRRTVEQMATNQDKMARDINRLAADVEMLSKIPAHPSQPYVSSARKPMPTRPPTSARPTPPLTLHP